MILRKEMLQLIASNKFIKQHRCDYLIHKKKQVDITFYISHVFGLNICKKTQNHSILKTQNHQFVR